MLCINAINNFMKNQLAFIPDNISAISGASVHIHPTSRNEVHDLHGDSTDMFIDEILKQRTEKGSKEKDKIEKSSGIGSNIRFLQDFKESQESNLISDLRLKQSMKASRDKHSKFELYLHQNESIAQKPQLSELNDSNRKSQVSQESDKKPQKSTIQQQVIEDKFQILHNQTNQDYIMEKELHEISNRQTEREPLKEDSEHKFVLPKIDRISNHQSNNASIEQSHFIDQKIFKQNNSFNHSNKQESQHLSNNHEKQISHKDLSQRSEVNQSKRVEDLKKSFSSLQRNQELYKSPPSIKHGSGIKQNQFIKQFQSIESKIQSEMSGAFTPAKLLNQNHGYYEFTGNKLNDDQQDVAEFRNIAIAITERLNFDEKDEYQMKGAKHINEVQETSQHGKKSISSGNANRSNGSLKNVVSKQSPKERLEEAKADTFQDDIQTQYSQVSRDLKILQHRYESNLAYLYAQTQQLQSYYRFMVLEEEKIDLKKQIITQQIQNKREKIQLRTASYTKRFNFIHPIQKNNDETIDYTPKRPLPKAAITRCQQIKEDIQNQKKTHIQLEAKLNLLSRYYDIMKSRTISDNLEFETIFKYDSQIGTYVPINGRTTNESQCSIANNFQTPKKLLNKTKSQTRLGKSKSKTLTLNALQSPSKKVKEMERTPLALYNLMRFKSEISKDMMLEYEVYNLGRMKRIKDETRLLKKQLDYVDAQIEHFDRSFAEELKKIEELQKPKKVTYQTYQLDQKDNPYTKSPFCRDYNGNNRGMNNINVYRADSTDLSRKQINKSLSKSRYTIQRQKMKDLSLSKQQIAANISVSLNNVASKPELFTTQAQSNKIDVQRNNDDYGLFTMGNDFKAIQQTPIKREEIIKQFRRTPKSKASLSRDKNLTRFKTQANMDASRSPQTTLKLRLNLTNRNLSKSKPNIKSYKTISIQNDFNDN